MAQSIPDPFLEFLIQFTHPEKMLADMPGMSEETCAAIFGLKVDSFRRIKQRFADRARKAAGDLLEDSAFAAWVDRLPFLPGDKVVGVGDSITDDSQSWLEILRYLLEIRRSQDAITVINAGNSGDTTSQIISWFLGVVVQQPAWIIFFAGANDTRLHGQSPRKGLVSIEETEKNLLMLRKFAADQTSARWVWITPTTILEEKVSAFWSTPQSQQMWLNKDLAAISKVILAQKEPVIDLQSVFGSPSNPDLLLMDGLHPSLNGQKAIVRALVEKLGNL
ncbi:MAG: SGNH/GDSL hydrolase family protein [Desulfobacteraceae bacterium]|nr:SGNH/GDSL hydrolase family protein [Desulfobacteraceae bacterium]